MIFESDNEQTTTVVAAAPLPHGSRPCLLTVRQFCAQYQWPTESAVRSYIFRAEENGLSNAFIRVGRRVLIDVEKFFEIIKGGAHHGAR